MFPNDLTAVELFAGVGGFHLGLKEAGWTVVWANQWEPPGTASRQFAYRCYQRHLSEGELRDTDARCVNDDIAEVAVRAIPEHTLLVGGFPCQDYSVAKPLRQATGIHGKKGVLWWEIYRILAGQRKPPRYVLLENVDRLLKSPVTQRGRDFAIILACFTALGYEVEWRVVNAADYGFAQKRRRVFILARRPASRPMADRSAVLDKSGTLAKALPVEPIPYESVRHAFLPELPERRAWSNLSHAERDFKLQEWAAAISTSTLLNEKKSPFSSAGFMVRGAYWSAAARVPLSERRRRTEQQAMTLGEVIAKTTVVPEEFLVTDDQTTIDAWKRAKGAKKIPRRHEGLGFDYDYAEGAMSFPDRLVGPARTILTSEGGRSPSRSKHIIELPGHTDVRLQGGEIVAAKELRPNAAQRFRRLTPEELEELNGFPRGWTSGMTPSQRAFCMGNALVVGVVKLIAAELAREALEDD